MLTELLRGGNSDVQKAVHEFVAQDDDNHFCLHLKTIIDAGNGAILERHRITLTGWSPLIRAHIDIFSETCNTMALLKQICENHNPKGTVYNLIFVIQRYVVSCPHYYIQDKI